MPNESYLEFELQIEAANNGGYVVAVRSPAGETRAPFSFDGAQLAHSRHQLEQALAGQPAAGAQSATPIATAKAFGSLLHEAVLPPAARALYLASRRLAESQQQGLRVELRILPVELTTLPWEFLYDAQLDEFVALSRHTPLVRYIEVAQPVQPLAIAPPLRILAAVAAPSDAPPVDGAAERQRLEQAVAGLVDRGLLELTWLTEPTWRGLQSALQGGPWHVFHFIGHAAFDPQIGEGLVVFEDDGGRAFPLDASRLGQPLHDHRTLRLVVLNACEGARGNEHELFSSTAAVLMRRGLPAVLAMQYPITDRASVEFTGGLYGALAAGLPIDAAVSEMRTALYLGDPASIEWGTPVLFLRALDGVILDIKDKEQAMDTDAKPWWEQLPGAPSAIRSDNVSGDVIIAHVGAGAKNVAVGKHISQTIQEVLGQPTPDDKSIIQQQFAQLRAALAGLRNQVDGAKLQMADFQLQLLEGELTKTDAEQTPSASTVTQIGSWLLDNLPEIAEAVTSLFATPAVGRVIGRAGDAAVAWARQRFA